MAIDGVRDERSSVVDDRLTIAICRHLSSTIGTEARRHVIRLNIFRNNQKQEDNLSIIDDGSSVVDDRSPIIDDRSSIINDG